MKTVVELFPKEILAKLKTENGGLQTLLKNHHQIFLGTFLLTTHIFTLQFFYNKHIFIYPYLSVYKLYPICCYFCLYLAMVVQIFSLVCLPSKLLIQFPSLYLQKCCLVFTPKSYMHVIKTNDTLLWTKVKERMQLTIEKSKALKQLPPKIDSVKSSKLSDYLSKRILISKPKRKVTLHREQHIYCVLDALVTLGRLEAAWDLVVSCQQFKIKLVPNALNDFLWACIDVSNGTSEDKFHKAWDIVIQTGVLTYGGFASKICYHYKHSQFDEIRDVLVQMKTKNYFPKYIIGKSNLTSTQANALTEALARVDPEILQVPSPNQNVNIPSIIREFYSEKSQPIATPSRECNAYVLTADELKAQLKTQLELELATKVDIPSILSSGVATNNPVIQKMREHKSKQFKKILETWKDELSVAIKKEQEKALSELDMPRIATGRRGPVVPKETLFLCLLPSEIWADLLINNVALPILSYGVSGMSSFQVTSEIGYSAWRHYVIRKKDSVGLFSQLSNIYTAYIDMLTKSPDSHNFTPREYWESLMEKHANSLDVSYSTWTYSVIDPLAFHLLYLFVNKLSMPRLDTEPVQRSGKPFYYLLKKAAHEPGVIVPDAKLVRYYKIIGRVCQESVNILSSDLPTLVPPKPWSSFRDGGMLCHPTFLFRTKEGYQEEILADGSLPVGVFDSLNILGNLPWRVNRPILDEVVNMFREGGSEKLGVPVVPWKVKEMPKWNVDLTPEDFFHLKLAHKLDKKERGEAHSLYMDMLYRLSVSRWIGDQVFWLPHYVDFRGRAYPLSPILSHMGGDVQRGILKFAAGKPLGQKGLDWLKIHLINLTGLYKRASLEDRLKAADNLIGQIIESADRPMEGNKWWRTMDEPWQVLAVCREIRDAIASGDPESFVSHIPVHQDGSCNGLQHYAALGRDPVGAQSVNLCPDPLPADVYSEVAVRVEILRAADAKNGNKIAQKLEGMISRKVVKQPVMTEVYGVTVIGARLQVETQLKELVDWPNRELFEASMYIVRLLSKSMMEMFQNAKAIQNWFARGALLISKHYPVEWVTPIGLTCTQPYHKAYTRRITTKLQKSLKITYKSEVTNKPNVYKQRNGFPPNFVHSLDSAHMMLTSLHCKREGVAFMSVHDSYWTHAATVEQMGKILREQFIRLHSEPILENLSRHFLEVFSDKLSPADILFLTKIPSKGNFDISQIARSVYFFS